MAICIYRADATDFAGNGLGVLTPIRCEVTEESCGKFELELVQPIDDTLRWAQLARGCIIKVPVPTRESPLYEEIEEITEGENVTRERTIYRVYNTSVGVYMRDGPGMRYRERGYLKNGDEVVLLDVYDSNWYHVCVVNGGRVCYMSRRYLTYARTETEIISQMRVVGHRVIKYAQHQDQLFRICDVKRDTKAGVVTAKAMHVFYDLRGNMIGGAYDPENVPMNEALQTAVGLLMEEPEHSLHIAAGMTEPVTGQYGYKNPVEAMLEPESGMLAQGKALLMRDNFDIFVVPQTERDSGVTIRRGKNLKGVTVTEDGADIVTRVIPCGKDADGNDLLIGGSGYVDSPRIAEYPYPMIKKIDYNVKVVDDDADGETTFGSVSAARQRLEELAQNEFSENGIDLPEYSMKVDFVLLQNTAEYADYAALQTVYMNDTVRVIDSMIGLESRVRVTAYKWDCLTRQYNSLSMGKIDRLEQTVYSYNLPTGGISGAKIAPGSADGGILRDLTLQYAKISTAAIERLAADSITALTARINEIDADTIRTNELAAAFAHIINLSADRISAGQITTGSIIAALANLQVITAGTATFDAATVRHLVGAALNIENSVNGDAFIRNLRVAFAQIVSATIGDLCIKASNGNYYLLDVDADGAVTAIQTQVNASEIASGHTGGGKTILDTEITAANLSTANLFATYALVNKIDAARIDVDTLMARQAFIDRLYTSQIFGGKSLQIIAGDATAASAAASAAQDAADSAQSAAANAQGTAVGAQSAADQAGNAAAEIGALLDMWFSFSAEGLRTQRPEIVHPDGTVSPASIWSTLVDDVGFHIYNRYQAEPVGSFARNGFEAQNIRVGDIEARRTSAGGWAFVWDGDD